MTTADLHTATGAYVLHALSPQERTLFEEHLEVCEPCTQEVRELSATTARLGAAAATAVPPQMKARVMLLASRVRQEPPPGARSSPAAHRRWWRRPVSPALAACAAAAVALSGIAVWEHRAADDARSRAGRAEQHQTELSIVVSAPDARSAPVRLKGGGHATVVISRALDRAVFIASDLPEPPAGKAYQLWFADGGTMRGAGVLTDAAAGAAVLDGRVGTATAVGLTVEPAGGSPRPTMAPLALASLPR